MLVMPLRGQNAALVPLRVFSFSMSSKNSGTTLLYNVDGGCKLQVAGCRCRLQVAGCGLPVNYKSKKQLIKG